MAITQPAAAHAFAVGDTVNLVEFPEEGDFTVTRATGHNLYNGLPVYQLTAPDGDTIDRITEPNICRK